jgi:hypothetical protein
MAKGSSRRGTSSPFCDELPLEEEDLAIDGKNFLSKRGLFALL